MWLKKYMKIEYLQKTLKNNEIYMGKPQHWSDKNDAAALEAFARHKGTSDIQVTCLTTGSDRYHFWDIYGDRALGVCLWYDYDSLLFDINQDPTLKSGVVKYYTLVQLQDKCKACDLAFAKRRQYCDENEFRVFRQPSSLTGLKFQPKSLFRIYFNPWMNSNEYELEKAKISNLLSERYKHVEIKHNQTLRYDKWIRAVGKVADDADSR